MGFQIAIDGPSGSGKSTLAKNLSRELNYIYVDTGAMYRAIGLYFVRNNIDYETPYIDDVLKDIHIDIEYVEKVQHIYLNGEDVSETIRTQEIAEAASKVGAIPKVREVLVLKQQEIASNKDVVMDGRDIGTFVLKEANLKIYLDASASERGKRRLKELSEKGIAGDFEAIKKEIEERDYRDMNRKVTPLMKASDAIYIDTDKLTEKEVLSKILGLVRER